MPLKCFKIISVICIASEVISAHNNFLELCLVPCVWVAVLGIYLAIFTHHAYLLQLLLIILGQASDCCEIFQKGKCLAVVGATAVRSKYGWGTLETI